MNCDFAVGLGRDRRFDRERSVVFATESGRKASQPVPGSFVRRIADDSQDDFPVSASSIAQSCFRIRQKPVSGTIPSVALQRFSEERPRTFILVEKEAPQRTREKALARSRFWFVPAP